MDYSPSSKALFSFSKKSKMHGHECRMQFFWSHIDFYSVNEYQICTNNQAVSNIPGGVGHGPKVIMGKKSKTAHLHLTFALFTSLVTP